jgi:hypothetical protein
MFPADVFLIIQIIVSYSYALKGPYSIEKYLKQGLELVVIEFETVKKVILIILLVNLLSNVIIVVFFNAYIGVVSGAIIGNVPAMGTIKFPTVAFVSLAISAQFMYMGIASLVMYGLLISKREFRFYLSKACFMSALNRKDTVKQMYYFGLGLQEYDRYLKRHLKHQIKDTDLIFSQMSLLDNDARAKVVHLTSNSFEIETDKLKPLKYISLNL